MRPEVVISGIRVDLPMNNPDGSLPDAGVNWLYDGATGAILRSYHHPRPAGRRDLRLRPRWPRGRRPRRRHPDRPDVYIPAVTQDGTFKGQGRGYVMSGDLNAFTSTVNFALLDDPTPASGGNFGSGYAAVGNLVDQTGKFRNEVLVGAGYLGEPGNAQLVNDIHIVDPLAGTCCRRSPIPIRARQPLRRGPHDARRPQRGRAPRLPRVGALIRRPGSPRAGPHVHPAQRRLAGAAPPPPAAAAATACRPRGPGRADRTRRHGDHANGAHDRAGGEPEAAAPRSAADAERPARGIRRRFELRVPADGLDPASPARLGAFATFATRRTSAGGCSR